MLPLFFACSFNDRLFRFRHDDVVDAPGDAGTGRVGEADMLDLVDDLRYGIHAFSVDDVDDNAEERLLRDHIVHVRVMRR